MTKLLDTQFPVIDHAEHIANIGIITSKEKQFSIEPNKREAGQFLCFINHGKKAVLLNFDEDKFLEIPKGVSAIRLQDLMNGLEPMDFKLPEGSKCEYFVIGRFVPERKY